MKIKLLQKYKFILGKAFTGFSKDNATKLSGSLAYSTIFSFPPMLLLIIVSGGYFYGEEALQGKVFDYLQNIVGSGPALQVQNIIKSLHLQENSGWAAVIGIVALVFGATSVFTEIQSSLNHIWGVQAKPSKSILKLVLDRLLSFSMIIGLGFILIISLAADALILATGKHLLGYLPWLPLSTISFLNQSFLILVLMFLFAFIFKILPDVKLSWRNVLPGTIVTTLLFLLGKFFIGLYIGSSNIISLYGAANSIIIFLVWIYFSSMILYFGAEFSKAWLLHKGIRPQPSALAEKKSLNFWNISDNTKKKDDLL